MKHSASFGLGMAATILAISGIARAGNVSCTGFVTGTIDGNVVVPANESCTIDNATISGNVTVQTGANLEINASSTDTTIGGSVSGNGCGSIDVENFSTTTRLVIRRNLSIQNCTGGFDGCRGDSSRTPPASVLIGGNFTCDGNDDDCVTDYCFIAGNVDCSGNALGCTIPSTSIGGNVKADNNGGAGVSIGNSVIGGNLTCSGNAAVGGTGNTIAGIASKQCAGL